MKSLKSIRFKSLVLLTASAVLVSAASYADDPAQGGPAPGTLSCGLMYNLYDPSAPPQSAPPAGCFTCTMADPQHSMAMPDEFKLNGSFTYLYMGAKSSNVTGSDELLSFSGSASINADGYSTGILVLRRGNQELVHVMAPIGGGSDLQVKIPGQGMKYKGKIVEQIQAYCYVK